MLGALLLASGAATAHHKAHWSRHDRLSLSGTIVSTYVGYPHSYVELDCGGEIWSLDISQPWRLQEIRLPVDALEPGVALEVYGHTTERGGEHKLKVVKMWLGGARYDF